MDGLPTPLGRIIGCIGHIQQAGAKARAKSNYLMGSSMNSGLLYVTEWAMFQLSCVLLDKAIHQLGIAR